MSLKYSLRIATAPVEIEGPDGQLVEYELREMSASARDKYLDSVRGRMQTTSDGKATVTKFEGMQADLISKCLYQKDGVLVASKVVQDWPSSVVSSLFAEAQKINRLNESGKEAADSAKNE